MHLSMRAVWQLGTQACVCAWPCRGPKGGGSSTVCVCRVSAFEEREWMGGFASSPSKSPQDPTPPLVGRHSGCATSFPVSFTLPIATASDHALRGVCRIAPQA